MVSERLANFAAFFAGWGSQLTPTKLEPRIAELFAADLREMAGQVAVMEGRPIPPHLLGQLPPGVARLDDARAERGRAAGACLA